MLSSCLKFLAPFFYLLVAIFSSTSLANARPYQMVSQTGGSWETRTGRTDGGTNIATGNFAVAWGAYGCNAQSGGGTTSSYAAASGTIVTIFRWVGGGTPPAQVIVDEYSYAGAASTSNHSPFTLVFPTVDNGFGDEIVSDTVIFAGFAQFGYHSEGMHSSVIKGTDELRFERVVSASASYPGVDTGPATLSSVASISYRVNVTPVELKLTGTLPVTDGLKGHAAEQALVGQKIGAQITGATLIKWTLPTEAFKTYVVTKTNGNWASVLNPILATDLTGSNPINFSCVSAISDDKILSKELQIKCECKALGNPVTLTKLLLLFVPDSALVSIIKNSDVTVSEFPPGTPGGKPGIWLRTQGDADAPAGIYFVGRVYTPKQFVDSTRSSGIFQYVQLIREQRYKTMEDDSVVPSLLTSNEFVLDTAYPYAPDAPTQWFADRLNYASSAQSSDTPSTQTATDVKRIEVRNERFETYLMYQPPGVDSQWVPLRVMYWGWNADATRPEGGWASWISGVSAGSLTGGADAVATDKHPIWSHSSF